MGRDTEFGAPTGGLADTPLCPFLYKPQSLEKHQSSLPQSFGLEQRAKQREKSATKQNFRGWEKMRKGAHRDKRDRLIPCESTDDCKDREALKKAVPAKQAVRSQKSANERERTGSYRLVGTGFASGKMNKSSGDGRWGGCTAA